MKYSWILQLVFWNVLHHITELIDNLLLIPFGWFMITNQGQRDHKKWYNVLCVLSGFCLQQSTGLYFLKNFKNYQK